MRQEQESYAMKFTDGRGEAAGKFHNFFPSLGQMRMCGDPPFFKVKIIADEQGTYWTWWDAKDNEFNFTAWFKQAVEICFPYGSKIEEQQGRGKMIRCRVEEVP